MLVSIFSKVGILSLGIAIGQGLIILSSPYVTKIYSAEDFGILSIVLIYCNIATASACFRYDLAITTADKNDIPNLIAICLLFILISSILAILLVEFTSLLSNSIKLNQLMIFFTVTISGLIQLLVSILTSDNKFNRISLVRVLQGGLYVFMAVMKFIPLAWAHLGGLFLAFIIGLFKLSIKINWNGLIKTMRKYSVYPKLLLPGALLDVAAYSLMLWIVINNFGLKDAGTVSQVQRIIGAPILLLSMSLGQVLLRHCQENLTREKLISLYYKCIKIFMLIGSIMFIFVYFYGSNLISLFIDSSWNVNEKILIPIFSALIFRAVASPLSNILLVTNNQKTIFIWQFGYFLTSASLYFISFNLDLISFLQIYALHEISQYILYLTYIKKSINKLCVEY